MNIQKLNLSSYGVVEMDKRESKLIFGGFLPLIVIYAGWAVMAGCSLIALGLKSALNER